MESPRIPGVIVGRAPSCDGFVTAVVATRRPMSSRVTPFDISHGRTSHQRARHPSITACTELLLFFAHRRISEAPSVSVTHELFQRQSCTSAAEDCIDTKVYKALNPAF